jgi:hypothetical protein
MGYVKIYLVLFLIMIGLGVKAQTFSYSYVDPCTKEVKNITVSDLNGNLPIVMNYYGQVKTFTPIELQNGSFDVWANNIFNNYGKGNPCAEIGIQTITANVLNISNNVINNVVSLSSMLTSITDVASTTGSITNVTGSVSGSAGTTGSTSGGKDNNTPKQEDKKVEVSEGGNNGGNGGGSNGGSGSGSGSSGKGNGDNKKEDSKQEEGKQEEQKQTSQSTSKSASRSTSKQDKPAIMLTGDIVGMQRAVDDAQDAKITTSFIKISGDRKKSLGVAFDFTVNAKVGNVSVFKSWITQKTTKKHIDLVSNSISLLPNSFSNTFVYIRIDNVKKFTGLYGVGGMYGELNKEPLTSLIAIGGGMFKGQVTKNVDAIFIIAAVYVPYMKYYTESVFQSKPLLLPFLNVNYKVTKTFKFGITTGTTYSATEQIVNYQILFGGKLTL